MFSVRGTNGSHPGPSSGESVANSNLSADHANILAARDQEPRADGRVLLARLTLCQLTVEFVWRAPVNFPTRPPPGATAPTFLRDPGPAGGIFDLCALGVTYRTFDRVRCGYPELVPLPMENRPR